MPAENIGNVVVTITGDPSQLYTALGAAQAAANAAGTNIASRLTAGMGPALAASTGLVDQFGRAIQSGVVAPVNGAQPALVRFRGQLKDTKDEMESFVGVIPGLGRAAERFVGLIPGLGNLIVGMFPVLGAIALLQNLRTIIPGLGEASAAEKNLAKVTEDTNREFDGLVKTFERLKAEQMALEFGRIASVKLNAFFSDSDVIDATARIKYIADLIERTKKRVADDTAKTGNPFVAILEAFNPLVTGVKLGNYFDAKDQIKNIQAYELELDTLKEKVRVSSEQAATERLNAEKLHQEEIGRLRSARISNEEQANSRLIDISRITTEAQIDASHRVEQARIDDLRDANERTIAEAQEDVRVAQERATRLAQISKAARDSQLLTIGQKASADVLGKTPAEQAEIQIRAEGDVARARDEYTKSTIALQNTLSETITRSDHVIATAMRDIEKSMAEALGRSTQDEIKKTGETLGGFVKLLEEAQKTSLKLSEIQPRVSAQQAGGALDLKALQARRDYQLQDSHTASDRVVYEQQIADIQTEQSANRLREIQSGLQIDAAQHDKVKLADDALRYQQELAASKNQEYSAETKILEAQKQRTLYGQLSEKGVGKGAGSIADQTTEASANLIAGSVNHISSGLANAVVHGNNLSRAFRDIAKQLGAEALTGVLKVGLNTVLAGLQRLIPAFGSVAAAQVAAAAAAKATTSAVDFSEAEGNIGVAATGAAAALAWIPIVGPGLATAAAAAMASSLQPYAALAAFAEGGRPPRGVASLVGEKGPELFVPDQAGTIIPNHMLGGESEGPGLSTAGASHTTNFHGDIHVHGARDAQETARRLPYYLKSRFSGFSPVSSRS